MACCCIKISKLKDDIIKISNAKNALQTLRNNNGALDMGLSELGRRMQEMATPDNMGSCAAAVKNLNKGSESTIDVMINQCANKISALQSEQMRYEREDTQYHQ